MSLPDLLNAAAQLCNGTGLLLTVLIYKRPDSRTIVYQKSEGPIIQKRDSRLHRLAVVGFVVLGLGFLLQIIAELVR